MHWPWNSLTLSFFVQYVPLVAGLAALILALGRHWRLAIALLLVAAAVPRLYAAADPNINEWDEAYHMLVAKHFLAHPLVPTLYDDTTLPFGRLNWNRDHIWLHKQPLTMWTMALSMRLAGVSPFAARLPSALASTLAILLTYMIGRRLYGPATGFFAAVFHLCTPVMLWLASGALPTDHVDTLLIFLIELGVYLALRDRDRSGSPLAPPSDAVLTTADSNQKRSGPTWRWAAATGVAAGLAFLTKWSIGLLILPLWLFLVLGYKPWRTLLRDAAIVVAFAFLLAAPWQIYIHLRWPEEAAFEQAYNLRHIHQAVEGHAGDAWWHLDHVPLFFGWLAFLAPILFLFNLRPRNNGPPALLFWLITPYAFFSYVATKMPAYVLIAAPALFIMEGRLCACAVQWRGRWWIQTGALGAAILGAAMLTYPGFNLTDQMAQIAANPQNPAPWLNEVRRVAAIPHRAGTALYHFPGHAIELMFLTDFTAYPELPDDQTVKMLVEHGHDVFIYAPPAKFTPRKGLTLVTAGPS